MSQTVRLTKRGVGTVKDWNALLREHGVPTRDGAATEPFLPAAEFIKRTTKTDVPTDTIQIIFALWEGRP